MTIIDPATWRLPTRSEMLTLMNREKDTAKSALAKKRKKARSRSYEGLLVFRSLLSPYDVYSYLQARFGEPNGMQSVLIHKIGMVTEDSANMFHWDYVFKGDVGQIYIVGAAREVHVMTSHDLTDAEWLKLAENLKDEFGKWGKQKSAVSRKWQKWHVFPNRYNALAARCAELYADLVEVEAQLSDGLESRPPPKKGESDAFNKWGESQSDFLEKLTNSSVQLSILTPVLFESFLGLIIAVLLKKSVRENSRLKDSYQRSPLDVKIYELSAKCNGFIKPILESNKIMKEYWKIVNARNDIIHGNVDPVRDAIEIVYFEGNAPIYKSGGDSLQVFTESLIRQYNPANIISDYLLCHEFIIEIMNHMVPPVKKSIEILLADTQPGWDDSRKKLGKLFPDYVFGFGFEGIRYDTDLKN